MSDSQHLTREQIDWLIENQPREPGLISRAATESVRQHLASCEACRKLVHMHEEIVGSLRRLGEAAAGTRGNGCASETELCELAAGILAPERAAPVMEHVITCDYCGPLLQQLAGRFAAEATSEEAAFIEKLPSAQPSFASGMAKRLAAQPGAPVAAAVEPGVQVTPSAKRTRFVLWPVWAMATVLVLVVALGSWWLYKRTQPAYADQLLAQAYTEKRTMELRIPGAQQAPIRVERGASDRSQLSRPAALLEAEALIAKELAKHPEDPRWLDARGRAELLDWNYEAAIKSYKYALDEQPDSPDLLTGLATAYFQRAEAQDRAIDYGQAIEYLGQSLAKRPDDPVALYNRAIACEKMFLYQQAIEDWEHYLRVDPNGAWSTDVKDRLAALRQKLKAHENARPVLFTDPAQFVRWARNSQTGTSAKLDDPSDEHYLAVATTEWLPALYSGGPSTRAGGGRTRSQPHWEALNALAKRLEARHGDRWLTDLLSASSRGRFWMAAVSLAKAIEANDNDNAVEAKLEAAKAEDLFKQSANKAGELRSRAELVLALHLEQEGAKCARAIASTRNILEQRAYIWLRTQFRLEEATCQALLGQLGKAEERYTSAALTAQAHNYGVIYLRTQDHLAGMEGIVGDFPSAWQRSERALKCFWSAAYPPMRGYNLYYEMQEFARMSREIHLRVAVWREGLKLSDVFANRILLAMAHTFMANATMDEGNTEAAERELAVAARYFSEAPENLITRAARLEANARLATVEAETGRLEEATTRLKQIEADVGQAPETFVPIMFYAARGAVESRLGHQSLALAALMSSVRLAENHLKSLQDEKSKLDWIRSARDSYRALAELKIREGDIGQALEIWELYLGAAVRAGHKGANGVDDTFPKDLSALRSVTEESSRLQKATVLAYAFLPSGLGIWVYDNRGLTFQWSGVAAPVVVEAALRFWRLCSNPASDPRDLNQEGRRLYAALVGPVERQLMDDRAVLIETDGVLNAVPFQALVDGEGRYLGDRSVLVSSLGTHYRRTARRYSPISVGSTALVVAVPQGDIAATQLSPLPDAVSEGEVVAGAFRDATLIRGAAATRRAVLAGLTASEVFHFSGHASTAIGQSGLILADGPLNASSLQAKILSRLELAVLSGCETSGGRGDEDSDAADLARAFVGAGVPHVVASRWAVDSAGAEAFMRSFYASVLAGLDVPTSVQKAQKALRERTGMAHPYYWSAFSVFGSS